MAKAKNTFTLDTAPLEGLVQKILDFDGDAREAVESALEQAAETISDDTLDAIAPGNLPAQGRYSTGATEASVLHDARGRRLPDQRDAQDGSGRAAEKNVQTETIHGRHPKGHH